MQFSHSSDLWCAFPELVAGVVRADGIDDRAEVADAVARHTALALARLEGRTESDLQAIQAWRRAFQRMGLKPTQYRCASEALLRRLRKEGALPRVHPLVDLCNAVSVAYAIPVAALDLAQVTGSLQVRHAAGSEDYLSFGGAHETPEPGEVSFVDDAGSAHARRWTNRQSALSAIAPQTASVLIVAEALHDRATDDVRALVATLERELQAIWSVATRSAILSRDAPAFDL